MVSLFAEVLQYHYWSLMKTFLPLSLLYILFLFTNKDQ